MRVLVVGNGGREHALAWKFLQSPQVQQVVCVPGNGGTASLKNCRNLALSVDDFEGIARYALVNNIGMIVVGPELPLSLGITDYLKAQELTVFGPTREGAQIESSKAWAKDLMKAAGIPTARAEVFTDAESAIAYIRSQGAPIVIKADGLAAGKGVTVAMTLEQAETAVTACFSGQFGAAGSQVVIEEYLQGEEVSILAVTDGLTIRPLLPAQDHKRIGENDTGENTGGMGAYAPAPIVTPDLKQRIQTEILEPAIQALRDRNIDYRGILYAGLIITPEGDPKVIEFNCRFGDPETQVVLPLLETPLEKLLYACAKQKLANFPEIEWKSGAATCVVIASEGYPGNYPKGLPINGITAAEETGAAVFHAGTQMKNQQIVTDGGRVFGVTAIADTFDQSIEQAYRAVDQIQFEGMYFRRDIAHRVRGKSM
ncbi:MULTISPECIES: phosphoribosylamine--glycine ligase [Leptolyngbya]|uniref:Phosphoribosylamine--glycine ligase n=1 Tax=Leptolyngbya boryana NIES-2135 TaxID=1973484 RepID=A0A1Z4JKR5_LEPBY|nr:MULTISPECIES: phosphoribosylamine--glycine ligase [Leptolyngbya]MBD1854029.1 phosphoribosylamine--glycine ligase [Leptolyngbya sp. FACHB-1624]MBD2366900.1 phosphoribosylamine--glycine ligase [Leptolyngbya sp. FACHB-161]MBD2378008.1 phosphoribosylamine--glycine ligase [Leptolyngbya sp. FACHB-238]MBD2398155.1 phosphoribosylamine--glycine ligase [Leptolyngbya sp. FACHB-239]MBD2408784.1 phosphoribosylamine--glycine ligase [Leptolyngbya sp. FACHB-402]BAY57349.1 phosphoribosylamine--glycine liga